MSNGVAIFSNLRAVSRQDPRTLSVGINSNADPFLAAVRRRIAGYLLKDPSAGDVEASALHRIVGSTRGAGRRASVQDASGVSGVFAVL